ncbi:MAG: hypothetical protein NTZ40_10890 [Cyanobacteria bacterium]|nr:hypothetical protein [Cyanobacteriota bacterium]
MNHPTLRLFSKSSISAATLSGIVFAGSLLPQQAKAFIPSYTTTNPVLGNSTAAPPISSYGFFFDTASDVYLDALGFAGDLGWGNNTSYTVKLWSYINSGSNPVDYTLKAQATFVQGTPYTLQYNYYWQTIAGGSLFLPDTSQAGADPSGTKGYVISTIGNFSGTSGNILPQFVDSTGSVSFDSRIQIAGNGFTDATDTLFPEIPITDISTIGNNGWFNANMSFSPPPPAVPGPLPLLGAVAAFSWTRRLRKRISFPM